MEKKQYESMESKCSSSSNIKDDLPKAKEHSKNREKRMGGLLERIRGRNMIIIWKKGVRTKSKGYKADGIVLMMKKKDIKQ